MYVSSQEYPSGPITEFNFLSVDDPQFDHLKKIKDSLVFQEERSFGTIYKRSDNNDYWYLATGGSMARFIATERLDLFIKWEKEALLPTNSQFDILSSIGGLPSSKYSLEPPDIRFPACIVNNNGQEIDLCIICFSKAPPFQRYFKNLIFLNEVSEIIPSELALSHQLRLSSTLAEDIRMGFFPFMVKTKTDKLVTYNGITQFASAGDIKGEDIISQVNFSYDNFDKIQDVSNDNITYVIGKWDERMDILFREYKKLLNYNEEKLKVPSKKRLNFWQKNFLNYSVIIKVNISQKSAS